MHALSADGSCRARRGAAARLTPVRRSAPALGGTRARPGEAALSAAVERGATVRDVIAPGLHVLFCGINPGRWSGAVGHHFAHPNNRFWRVLQLAGFTADLLGPAEERRLLASGLGITNLVARTTASAADVSADELRRGSDALERKVRRLRPRAVAFLGLGAYRTAFGRRHAEPGLQPERIGAAAVWVLPNPSGLQAHYQLDALVELFGALRLATEP